ncbi:GrpB family protein [Vibrio alginolyticus]|uniref:GrpB family protein n=1 Tax=Vibrio alginolyticus TaxID=663 RepID=UPI001C9CB6F7|nr:GrpB family protein [Vibrio alginolyticus]MBY7698226.1 GrpB family protein [Vibrio alginolyticus]
MSFRVVEVVEYRDEWVSDFTREKGVIRSVLNSDNIVAIHHIGSTSVKGLCAKPIIDILIEVKNLDALDAKNDYMNSIGYRAKGEHGIPGRRYFQKGGEQLTHQIHAFVSGSEGANRHLAFRDYLIAFPSVALAYGRLKQEGAAICNNDIGVYCDYKDSFIKEHEATALKWKFA